MFIKEISVKNFRNLDNVLIKFVNGINFIIGENNLGKSNLLDLLEILFLPNKNFEEDDFYNIKNPIECKMTLELNEYEIGLFDDFIDYETGNTLRLKFIQESPEGRLECFWDSPNEPIRIDRKKLRCANFIKYVSVRKPDRELKFERSTGAGRFLRYLLIKAIKEKSYSFDTIVNEKVLKEIRENLENILKKLKFFQEFNLTTEHIDNLEKFITSIFILKENDREISSAGYGVQFILTTLLAIFEKIVDIVEKREDCIWTDNKGKKYISILLALDEPEVHLHPYMQRSLIKYLERIINNNDTNFKEVINNLFDIEKVFLQIFIVTHSPNILSNDYKSYIRFFRKDNILSIKSGIEIDIPDEKVKHFYRNHLFLKEAFFSRCVILVEGDTEFGALYVWANYLLGDIDNYGISIIKVDGKNSLKPVRKILNDFGIPNIIVVDSDNEDFEDKDNVFITKGKDFEEDIINTLWELGDKGKKTILFILEEDYKDALNYPEAIERIIYNMKKEEFIKKFRKYKSYTFGQKIAEKMFGEVGIIPEVYKNAILRAKELSMQ